MSLSVIIPSKNTANAKTCIDAVLANEPGAHIILIDDGLDYDALAKECYEDRSRLQILYGEYPFIYARNCNIGIREAEPRDVVLLNDDALLKTPQGFTRLQQQSWQHPEYGLIAATTNVTGQPLQQPQNVGLRPVPHVAFVCVFIPRKTIDLIGPLDERYCLDYGVEDLDYCEACTRAGLKVGVDDRCFVDHASLTSTFRGHPHSSRSFAENKRLFDQKWNARLK